MYLVPKVRTEMMTDRHSRTLSRKIGGSWNKRVNILFLLLFMRHSNSTPIILFYVQFSSRVTDRVRTRYKLSIKIIIIVIIIITEDKKKRLITFCSHTSRPPTPTLNERYGLRPSPFNSPIGPESLLHFV